MAPSPSQPATGVDGRGRDGTVVRVADTVLAEVAADAARRVAGVVALRSGRVGVATAFVGRVAPSASPADGVRVRRGPPTVIDIGAVVALGEPCLEVAKELQRSVGARIADLTGVDATVSVDIVDVETGGRRTVAPPADGAAGAQRSSAVGATATVSGPDGSIRPVTPPDRVAAGGVTATARSVRAAVDATGVAAVCAAGPLEGAVASASRTVRGVTLATHRVVVHVAIGALPVADVADVVTGAVRGVLGGTRWAHADLVLHVDALEGGLLDRQPRVGR
jgi:uncharacterized alkaline shock family protein YloU